VIRPRRHHAGKKFFVCNSDVEVQRAILRCGPGWYATELVDKAAEYRVFVLQDRVIRISTKHQNNPGEVAWNVGNGANAVGMARKNWPLDVIKVAIKAARKLGLDFTAVDVCVSKAGQAYVLEANTAPGLQSGSKALEQIAWAFGWIPKNDAPARLNVDSITRWQDVLHPSLLAAAEETN
jgi:glutathione synthase/RimK-type ligase-like ATP-grasp enzyme